MNEKYENVEVELTDEEFLHIAKCAHERDITFNKMVENILLAAMQQIKEEHETGTS